MSQAESYYKELLQGAQRDSDILGLILDGSRGKGFANAYADYDISLIVHDRALDRVKAAYQHPPAMIEVFVYTLDQFNALAAWGGETAWDRYNYTHLVAQIDKLNGHIQALIEEKGRIPSDKVTGVINHSLDHYINQVYRSLKCLRIGDMIGYHFEASESIRPLLTAMFALHDGRLLPYYK